MLNGEKQIPKKIAQVMLPLKSKYFRTQYSQAKVRIVIFVLFISDL